MGTTREQCARSPPTGSVRLVIPGRRSEAEAEPGIPNHWPVVMGSGFSALGLWPPKSAIADLGP
jgi:hypothetical protein